MLNFVPQLGYGSSRSKYLMMLNVSWKLSTLPYLTLINVIIKRVLNGEFRADTRFHVGTMNSIKLLRAKANKAFHRAYQSKLEEDCQTHHKARRAFKKEFR